MNSVANAMPKTLTLTMTIVYVDRYDDKYDGDVVDKDDEDDDNKPGRAIRCVLRRFLLNANGHTDPRTYGRTDGQTLI